MTETAFEQFYSAISRLAAVRAATTATLYGLSQDFRNDLQQEALLELWRKHPAYDPQRGSWRTFAEHVVTHRLRSFIRYQHAVRRGYGREECLSELVRMIPALDDRLELRLDVRQVLARVSQLDRAVALSLIDFSAVDTGRRLGVSRATVYRAIGRLRVAFTAAGYADRCEP
jgi:RNA polymerase sigma factor (sigma-70 family)